MKPFILLSILAIYHQFCIGQSKAEKAKAATDTVNIIYNMHEGKFEKGFPPFIKEGSTIALSYKAINPFAYKSNVTFTDINHNFQDGMDVVQSGLNGLSGTQQKTTAALETIAGNPAVARAFFNKTLPNKKLEDIKPFLSKKNEHLKTIRDNFNEIQLSILTISAIMATDTLIKIAKNDPVNFSRERMESAIINPVSVYGITRNNIPDKFRSNQQNIYTRLSNISSAVTELKGLSDKATQKEIEQITDSVEKKVTALNNIYTGNNVAILLKNTSIIQANLDKALNADFNLPATNIHTANGDFIEISDQLKDNNDKLVFSIAPHTIRTYGGSRVDFSIGLTANIGGNGWEYSLRKDSGAPSQDTSKVVLYESRKNKFIQFNPGVFIHWYSPTWRKVQWMLTTGLAPDFSTLANSRLFIGTSLGFPSSNELSKRLVLSVGASIGYADVLKTKYRGWENYQRFSDLDDNELTEKSLRLGGFFAVSYNLGGTGHKSSAETTK